MSALTGWKSSRLFQAASAKANEESAAAGMSHCQATSLDLPRLSMTEVDRFLPARHCAGYTQ
jgi:hypothetical protein